MPHEVFVSYAQTDREAALTLTGRLEARGLRCWIAPRDISPAADWAQEILEAIAGARAMVLVFSARSNSSAHVRREVERAIHRNITVLPFRVEDVLPAGSLEYFLSAHQWLDAFPPPLEPHCDRLVEHLRRLLNDASGEASALGTRFDEIRLRAIELELAGHVGPIARYMIQRASARAANLAELVQLLGTEIDSDSARQAFLQACRPQLRGV